MACPVFDVHIHIQPWEQLKPAVRQRMARGRQNYEELLAIMRDPEHFLRLLDDAGVSRAGLINYTSPDLMGFTDSVNAFVCQYASHAPERLIPFGSVHPRFTKTPGDDVRRIAELGVRALKVHPPHQLVHANAYRDGGEWPGLAKIYGAAQELGLPVMVHTGTSVFPAARNKYANPMDVDDVAVDFPELPIILAHGGRPLWMNEAFFLLRRHQNVYMDVSGIPPKLLLDYFPRLETVADKALWGTDWPGPGVPTIGGNLEDFRALNLSGGAQKQILHENADRLFPR